MKYNIFSAFIALLLLSLVGCNKSDNLTPEAPANRTFRINLEPAPEMRAIIKDPTSEKVFLKWEEGMFDINIIIKQGSAIATKRNVEVKDVQGASCAFEFEIPDKIDINQPFDIYGVISSQLKVRSKSGKILVGIGGRVMDRLTADSNNKDGYIPMYFGAPGVKMYGAPVSAKFYHLGALATITVLNKSNEPLRTAGFAVRPADGTSEFYHKAALPFKGNEALPYFDLLNPSAAPEMIMTEVKYHPVDIPANDVHTVGFWFKPNTATTPEVKLAMYNAATRSEILSENTRPARAEAMKLGHAYNIYAEWDGTKLTLLDSEPQKPIPVDIPKMHFTTRLNKGETFKMLIGGINPEAERDIWIDLNNNGIREKNENISQFTQSTRNENLRDFTVDSQEFTIYGKVNTLFMMTGKLTQLDVTKNPYLDQLLIEGYNYLDVVDLTNNHKLSRVSMWGTDAKEIKLSPQATGIQEVYFAYNRCTEIDLSMATDALWIEVSNNKQLTSLKLPQFKDLWRFLIQNNNFTAAQLNLIFNKLHTVDQEAKKWYIENRGYNWIYSIDFYGNPGSSTADVTKLTNKGWVINPDPDAQQGGGEAQATPLTSRQSMVRH